MAGEMIFVQPRNALGKFHKLEGDIKALIERQAKQFVNEVADEIETRLVRPQDSTGRLAASTRKSGNYEVRDFQWVAGIPDFLAKDGVKYWRLVEQGSAGLYAHGRGFIGTPLKLARGGRFGGGRPFRSFSSGQVIPAHGHGNKQWIRTTVRHEIKAQHAYTDVWYGRGWKDRVQREFMAEVRNSFGA